MKLVGGKGERDWRCEWTRMVPRMNEERCRERLTRLGRERKREREKKAES